MIKIAVGTPGVTDGTSYYRAAGPMGRLRQQIDLELEYPPAFGWHDLKSADILMIQRPGNEDHERIIRFARTCDIPIWVDMDDDLLDVPMWNPGWEVFRERNELIKNCLSLAHVVTTATEELAKKWRQFNPNVIVVPNALDEKFLRGYDPLSRKLDPKTIYWRGAQGHQRDLWEIQDVLCEVANEHPDVRWQFAGYFPWFIYDKFAKLKKDIKIDHVKAIDVMEYFHYLKYQSTHSIAIVPLEDCPWNHKKSNIAWLENTLAGATVIAPSYVTEFDKPGVRTYKDHQGLKDQILRALKDVENKNTHREVSTSLDHILEHYTLSHVNKIRMDIVKNLLA